MKKFVCGLILLLAGAVIMMPGALSSQNRSGYEGRRIIKIDLKGNLNRDSTLIKAQLGSKVGGILSYKTLAKDVKDLFFLGFFSDIKVEALKFGGDGVYLTFIFEEYEKIQDILITGSDAVSKKDILELLTVKKGSVYNKMLVKDSIDKVLDKYRQEGYINAQVTPSVKTDPVSRTAVVTFAVNEGKKIVIEKITFIGCKQLEAGSVDNALEDTHASSLFRSGIYDEKKFDKDKERIVAYYQNRGFIKMRIIKVDKEIRQVRPDKPKQGIFLTIHVEEGERYSMGKFTFSGNEVFTDAVIRDEIFRLKSGQFFNEEQYKKDFAGLYGRYQELGYIFANIVPERTIDEGKKLVNLSFRIVEMDKAHVELIKIKGIVRTKQYVVEREIRIKEGEVFNRSKIVRSQQRLMNTRFFKDVKIDVEPGSAEGLMNLIFSMQEDRTGLFTLGAGYGTVSGLTAYQQLSENNFLGRGLRIYERIEFGQKKKSVQLGIDTPYLIKYDPTSLGFTVSYNNGLIEDIASMYISSNSAPAGDDGYHYLRNTFEIQLRGGRALGEYWRTSGSYTWAWLKSYDENFIVTGSTESNYPPSTDKNAIDRVESLRYDLAAGYQTKSSFRFGFIFDTRDYVGGPSRGIYWSQFMSYTGGILGGDSQHIMTDTKFSFFIPLMWNFVFAVDTNFEFIFNQLDGRHHTMHGDRLRFDGMTELRGWTNFDNDGRSKASFSIELRYPIEKTMLWGVFFYDIGMVWDGYNDINFDFTDYKHSIGFGFRLQLAMLPIRLYFARRFHYPDGEIEWVGGTKFFKGWETVFSVAGIF